MSQGMESYAEEMVLSQQSNPSQQSGWGLTSHVYVDWQPSNHADMQCNVNV